MRRRLRRACIACSPAGSSAGKTVDFIYRRLHKQLVRFTGSAQMPLHIGLPFLRGPDVEDKHCISIRWRIAAYACRPSRSHSSLCPTSIKAIGLSESIFMFSRKRSSSSISRSNKWASSIVRIAHTSVLDLFGVVCFFSQAGPMVF